ncbi:uncharacterized protein LOC135469000 [Liolophura sinensis]|uniref:uncharacterized protein LOC135469000 n=1 Tax=Liolophura sinensis TaxID=3198878 RepID=UPI003158976D
MRLKPVRSMWRRHLNLTILLVFPCILSLPMTSGRPWTPQHLHTTTRPSYLELLTSLQKRGCHLGLPCTYSHLSSIAAQRTLQRMMVDYMHNCVNDPRCSPGRRKRQTSSSKDRVSLRPKRASLSRNLDGFPGR